MNGKALRAFYEQGFSMIRVLFLKEKRMTRKDELHSRALVAARDFKDAEKALQEVLREIDQHRVFYDLGYRSLMEYAILGLGLTPDIAFNHCTVAKKSNDLPEIRKAVSEGVLSVSAVRHMAPVLTKENEREMIGLASQLTQTELRREIAKRNPEMTEQPEKVRYVREDRLALELRVSEELMKKLRRAQDLVSQSQRKLSSLEDTLEAMVDIFLEKQDPLKKAERAQKRSEKTNPLETSPGQLPLEEGSHSGSRTEAKVPSATGRMIRKNKFNLKLRRTGMPAAHRHTVLLKLGGQCSHVDRNGVRCTQKRWLHIHHIKPLSEGGTHDPENLTLLCSGHHRMIHRNSKAEYHTGPTQAERG